MKARPPGSWNAPTCLLACLAWASITATSLGQQRVVLEKLPQHLAHRVEEMARRQADPKSQPEALYYAKKLWPPGYRVRVCFLGGTPKLRGQIADIASEWAKHGEIGLDFGRKSPEDDCRVCQGDDRSEIHVSFDYEGYWSLVGTDGRDLARPGEATLNLAHFDVDPPPEPTFTGTILHEFGHALGLEHEHQNADIGCDFRWAALYEELAKYPNFWTRETVDRNLRQLGYFEHKKPMAPLGRDPMSVMHYSFPAWMFEEGEKSPCYVPYRFALSDGDREAMALMYPRAERGTAVARERTEALKDALAKPDLTPDARRSMQTKLEIYAPKPATPRP